MNKNKMLFSIFLSMFFGLNIYSQANMFDSDELFDAEIKIKYSQVISYPSAKEAYHVEKQQADITGQLSCQLMKFRLKQLVKFPEQRTKNCSPSTHCPILTGSSKYTEYGNNGEITNETSFPLKVSVTNTTMDTKSDKLVTTYTYSASGINDMDEIHLEIKPYNAPSGQPHPLTPNYVVWLTGGIGLDFANPQKKPLGDGTGKRWDNEKEMLVTTQGPFNIQIPSLINEADHGVESGEIYDQLLITNYKELDDFLLNPIGNFTIKASGKRYKLSEGTEETEGSVQVEITLSPRLLLHKLTK